MFMCQYIQYPVFPKILADLVFGCFFSGQWWPLDGRHHLQRRGELLVQEQGAAKHGSCTTAPLVECDLLGIIQSFYNESVSCTDSGFWTLLEKPRKMMEKTSENWGKCISDISGLGMSCVNVLNQHDMILPSHHTGIGINITRGWPYSKHHQLQPFDS
jgi:hypothetical protein